MYLVFGALAGEGVAMAIRTSMQPELETVSLFFYLSVWCLLLITLILKEESVTADSVAPLGLALYCMVLFLLGAQAGIERQINSTNGVSIFIGIVSVAICHEHLSAVVKGNALKNEEKSPPPAEAPHWVAKADDDA